jgi:hypothetical protein
VRAAGVGFVAVGFVWPVLEEKTKGPGVLPAGYLRLVGLRWGFSMRPFSVPQVAAAVVFAPLADTEAGRGSGMTLEDAELERRIVDQVQRKSEHIPHHWPHLVAAVGCLESAGLDDQSDELLVHHRVQSHRLEQQYVPSCDSVFHSDSESADGADTQPEQLLEQPGPWRADTLLTKTACASWAVLDHASLVAVPGFRAGFLLGAFFLVGLVLALAVE